MTVFLFLAVAYHRLTNTPLTWREVLPGAVLGAVGLQATFQALPIFLSVSKHVVRCRRSAPASCSCSGST